jgi:hypothetical protein
MVYVHPAKPKAVWMSSRAGKFSKILLCFRVLLFNVANTNPFIWLENRQDIQATKGLISHHIPTEMAQSLYQIERQEQKNDTIDLMWKIYYFPRFIVLMSKK